MRMPRMTWPMLILLMMVSPPLLAQTSPEPPKTFDLAAIDTYVAGVVRDKGIPGLALTIVRDGKIVLAKGYGQRSIEDKSPVETDTPFAIGSVTKQFACACIFLLAEDGKLSVDDKVSKYFPSLTSAGDITLYQLMTHTSGYTDYYPLDFVDRRMSKPIPLDTLIQEYAGTKLDFEPGSRWSYSNTGYIILGRVVEKVSGQSFGEFLRKRILNPTGDEGFGARPNLAGPVAGSWLPDICSRTPGTGEAGGRRLAVRGRWFVDLRPRPGSLGYRLDGRQSAQARVDPIDDNPCSADRWPDQKLWMRLECRSSFGEHGNRSWRRCERVPGLEYDAPRAEVGGDRLDQRRRECRGNHVNGSRVVSPERDPPG